jgi:inosine/xanthosine triphosphatase
MDMHDALLDVVVGSTNPTKVGAVRTVFGRLGWTRVGGVAVPSGVSPQPLGAEETWEGATTRARNALAAARAAIGVGLEGGVELHRDGSGWLVGAAVILTADGRALGAWGPKLWLPPAAVEAVRAGEELGPVIDRLSGLTEAKAGIGAIGWLTAGLVTREASWVVALACAAAPLFHPTLYPDGPHSS